MGELIPLRGGASTLDPKLDRVRQFDERSRSFGIMDALEDDVPRSMTWRCRAWTDQGQEGACVGHSSELMRAARPVEDLRITNESAFQHYKAAQEIDPWPGSDYSGTSVLAGLKVAKLKGYMREYRWAFGIDQLKAGLKRGPAILGIDWHQGMYRPDAQGYIRRTGPVMGGHAILCRGINLPGRYFLLRNSWGVGWGWAADSKTPDLRGDCRVTFDDMERLLIAGGEAAFWVGHQWAVA